MDSGLEYKNNSLRQASELVSVRCNNPKPVFFNLEGCQMGVKTLWVNVPPMEVKRHCQGCELYDERRIGYWQYSLCRPICIKEKLRHAELSFKYYHEKVGAL